MQPQAQTTTQENSSPILSNSYFTRFEKLIKEETNIDSLANKLDEFSKKDIFTNLKDFHESYDEGKAFLIHKDEFRDLLNQKINYLKTLETEWHDKKEKLEELKKEVKTKEERLIFEVDELKHLMNQIKSQEIGDRYFHTYDGKTLKSIKELKAFLQETTQEIFEYHVNEQKNDFANWIEHVFQIKDLSNKIKYIKNKEEMIKQL